MKLVPYEMQSYYTRLSPGQVKSVLGRFSGFFPAIQCNDAVGHPPFLAEIRGNSFRINSLGNQGGPMFSQVSGEISLASEGTRVKVKVRMNSFLLVLMATWLAWIEASGLFLFYQNRPTGDEGTLLFGLNLLFLVVYGFLLYAFHRHTSQSRTLFCKLLDEEGKEACWTQE